MADSLEWRQRLESTHKSPPLSAALFIILSLSQA
jgi:hypothetical protein